MTPDISAALSAYFRAYRCGDADAFCGMTTDWSRWPASTADDAFALDRAQGYADGYQETARQQEATS